MAFEGKACTKKKRWTAFAAILHLTQSRNHVLDSRSNLLSKKSGNIGNDMLLKKPWSEWLYVLWCIAQQQMQPAVHKSGAWSNTCFSFLLRDEDNSLVSWKSRRAEKHEKKNTCPGQIFNHACMLEFCPVHQEARHVLLHCALIKLTGGRAIIACFLSVCADSIYFSFLFFFFFFFFLLLTVLCILKISSKIMISNRFDQARFAQARINSILYDAVIHICSDIFDKA